MFRTISLKLDLDEKEANRLVALRKEYLHACNAIVVDVVRDRCWNRVALHKICMVGLGARQGWALNVL